MVKKAKQDTDDTLSAEDKDLNEDATVDTEGQTDQTQVSDDTETKISVEDIQKELESLKGEVAKRDKQIDSLQEDRDYFESRLRKREQAEKAEFFPEGETEKAPPEKKKHKWDFEDPAQAADNIFEAKWAEKERQREQKQRGKNAETAQRLYHKGRAEALERNPELFDGIMKTVDSLVYTSYIKGGTPLEELGNANTFTTAAELYHLKNRDFDRLKQSVVPVKAVQTEEPAGAKPDTTEVSSVELDYQDEEVREFMKQTGYTRKQAEEIIKSEQENVKAGDPTDLAWKRR